MNNKKPILYQPHISKGVIQLGFTAFTSLIAFTTITYTEGNTKL